ncbi:hypothetical protein F5Y04DRAFT_289286 [Hypomontagnella monticulosa]|nr:hypothetical protein F5Y04DRAFT_289286 [Hypomontagnella monticulosa]
MWSDGVAIENNALLIDRSITDWASHAGGRYYDNMTFPAANATGDFDQDAGVQFAYFKVEEPDPGCQHILMRDSERGWQILTKMPGIEILRASRAGCYYTPLNQMDNLITSYCCGSGDCAAANVEQVQVDPMDKVDNGDPPSCTVRNVYNDVPTVTNGEQIAITNPQTCEAPPTCTHTISNSRMIATAISHTQSYTWTTSTGTDVSIQAGIDMLTTTTTMTYSLAQAWMDETGTTYTQTNVTSTEEGGRQEMGTMAFYSFTPAYNCWTGDVACGDDSDGNEKILTGVSFCQPIPSTAQGGTYGIYNMVYISP